MGNTMTTLGLLEMSWNGSKVELTGDGKMGSGSTLVVERAKESLGSEEGNREHKMARTRSRGGSPMRRS